MKKLLAILLVLCMVLAAAACGSKEAAAPAADTKTEAAAPAAEETLKDKAAKFNRKDQFLTVGTGPTSGIYFPIGGAFATALKDYGYQTSAEAHRSEHPEHPQGRLRDRHRHAGRRHAGLHRLRRL